MNKSVLALSCAGIALACSPAGAQSLSDALSQALSPVTVGTDTFNCGALGAGVTRFDDTWQFVEGFGGDPDRVDITNGETGATSSGLAPVMVSDGTGRNFVVRGSANVVLDPAVADALSEQQIYDFLVQTGVQFVGINRFAAGNFGSGLNGFCQGVTARVNQNGNTSASGGFAGGSSSASGRSVSSLSSAREQSTREKKRKKKQDHNSSYEDGFIRLASNQGGLGVVADAAGVGPFGVQTFVDFRGGYTDIRRDATALESGFDGRALWGQGSLTAELGESVALAGSISYSRARGEFDSVGPSGGANGFRERNLTGGLFAVAALPIGGDLTLDLAAGGFYGGGKGEIARTFAATRNADYIIDVSNPAPPPTQVQSTQLRQRLVADDLVGEFDTRNYGFSAAASVSVPVGAFVLTPGVEFTWFSFRQDGYDESVADAFSNGFALSHSAFKDRWTETRIGGALARGFGPWRLEGYGDLVLTGGAETPVRTATFVEDLRPDPYVLSYRVDDLDRAFGVFGLVAAVGLRDGLEAFVGAETNVGHEYLTTRTIFAGVRFRP